MSSSLPFVSGFSPMASAAEAAFAAYTITVSDPAAVPEHQDSVCSGALLRAISASVLRDGGPVEIHCTTRAVRYTYKGLTVVFTARPFPNPHRPECARCGQWENEHRQENGSACGAFGLEPRPGTAGNPQCGVCQQPYLHHGRPFTVACGSFHAPRP